MNEFIAKVLKEARPTINKRDEKYLAVALGYPVGWHVVRSSDMIDTIYAGHPSKGVDCWFNHNAARVVAAEWDVSNSTPYDANGGHLLPKQAKYQKGDQVQVRYKKAWYGATILKRQKHSQDFLYTVHYTDDESTQANVEELMIRPSPPDFLSEKMATKLGLPPGWKAVMNGKRYTIISPDNQQFSTKKSAIDYLATLDNTAGDPPWRQSGHEFIGMHITFTSQHKTSARRTINVVQEGLVAGWISETDLDQQGEPGYVNEVNGKPTALFHITFKNEPGHPYCKYLLDSVDLEEGEVLGMLIQVSQDSTKSKPNLSC